jgi:hypothetical protein
LEVPLVRFENKAFGDVAEFLRPLFAVGFRESQRDLLQLR